MPRIARCAATALLLGLPSPQSTCAFVSQPSNGRTRIHLSRAGSTSKTVVRPVSASSTSQRHCVAGVRDARGGDDADRKKKKPPVTVLDRPWDVEVLLHGERRILTVQPGDSILEAAEMSGLNVSYECRRGNCISCAAKIQKGSSGQFENRADRRADDGAPEGFVLTCSTYPVGPGVKLELSANAEMWTAFCAKFDDTNTKSQLRQASASVMTGYNVRHPEEFRETVERQFGSQ